MSQPERTTQAKRRQPLTWLLAMCLLAPQFAVSVALAATELPDAGKALRESQQLERKLPERQNLQLETSGEPKRSVSEPAGLKILVRDFRITGNDVIPAVELDTLLASYKNKELTYNELQECANLVGKYFRDHGYFVAQAYLPDQEMEGSVVEINVLVGRYGEIIVKNQSAVKDSVIRWQLSGLILGHYVHTSQLERAALLAGDIAGITTKLTLAPGKQHGTTDVIVEAKNLDRRTQGSLSLNNWGNRFTGSNQVNLNLTFNNATSYGDSLATGVGNTGSGQTTGSLSWRLTLGEGQSLTFGYSKVRYELGEEFASLDAYGTASTRQVDWNYSLLRSRNSNLNLQVGYAHKRLEDLVDSSGAATYKRSHAVGIGVSGDSSDNLWGGGVTGYGVTWYRGGLSGVSSIATLAPENWEKTTFNFMRQQRLTDQLSLVISLSGQFAGTNLDTSERFSLGGANAVRAYPSGEGSGDEAWLLNGELRWSLPNNGRKGVTRLTAFYDTGTSHVEKNPTDPLQNRRSISGAGLGINYIVPGDYMLKAYYAWKTGSEAARSDNDKSGRFWIQGVKYF